MSANYDFVQHLAELAPVVIAKPGGSEFTRPGDWSRFTTEGNGDRIGAWTQGDALMGLMGGPVAVLDVDTKNGADPDAVRTLLDGIGVRVFGEVVTPSGGWHFYVQGHPDLPTVHATADRPGLTGYPGVEVMSFGTNVFLPGTSRPRYDGAGYHVVVDNLEALGDGGDPDGAEALAGWVAENRASRGESFTPAEPWDGTPPDARESAYLAATLRNLCERVANMAPDSGRNTAVFNAAMTCGNYIAGAGMDETTAMEELFAAAEKCQLVADDGQRSVHASIRSGLRNGRQKPRTVPEAPTEPQRPAPPAVEPVPLTEAHNVFLRWLGEDYDLDALNTMLAAAAVERLDGDPLWLLIVSGSGNAKTETVQALDGIGACVVSTITSDGALLSATSARERTKDATGGLLRELGDHGVLVVKDVTSILSMNRDLRGQVLGALREVHDGAWTRKVGTDGGKSLHWSGRIAVVGAVTTAWDQAHSVIASMGDRFVLLRMDSSTGRQAAGRKAIGNTGSEKQMRSELASAAAGVLAGMDPEATTLTEAEADLLLAAADVVTLARTGVEYDYRGDVIDAHAPEMPTRFAKELAQVVRGAVAVGMGRSDALRLAIRCARDSMPPLRLAILEDLAAAPGSSTAEVRKRLNKPRATVDRQLQALHMLGVIDVAEEEVEWAGRPGTRWYYTVTDGIDPAVLDPKSVPEMFVPTPNPLEERGEDVDTSPLDTDITGTDSEPPPPRCCSTCRREPGKAGLNTAGRCWRCESGVTR